MEYPKEIHEDQMLEAKTHSPDKDQQAQSLPEDCELTVPLQTDQPKFREYPYRYVIVVLYSAACLLNSFPLFALAPIAERVQHLYGFSRLQINFTTLLFYLAFPFANFLSNWVTDNIGLKLGMSMGNILMIVGTGMRLFIDKSIFLVMAGQFILGFGATFVINPLNKVSTNWFKPKNRAGVTILFSFLGLVSGAVGAIFPPMFVTKQYTKSQVNNLLWFEFYTIGGVMGLNLLLFFGRPPTPPSHAAQVIKEKFIPALKTMVKNKNYLYLLGSITCIFAATNALFSTIAYYIQPFSFDASVASYISIVCTVGGIFGNVIGGLYLKKTQQFKKISIYCLIVGTFLFGVSFLCFMTKNVYIVMVVIFFLGMSLYPVVPVQIELASEIVFPVGEATATGLLWATGQFVGFLAGIVQTFVVTGQDKTSSFYGFLIYIFLFSLSTMFMQLCKEVKKREQEEKIHNKQEYENDEQVKNQEISTPDQVPPEANLANDSATATIPEKL